MTITYNESWEENDRSQFLFFSPHSSASMTSSFLFSSSLPSFEQMFLWFSAFFLPLQLGKNLQTSSYYKTEIDIQKDLELFITNSFIGRNNITSRKNRRMKMNSCDVNKRKWIIYKRNNGMNNYNLYPYESVCSSILDARLSYWINWKAY